MPAAEPDSRESCHAGCTRQRVVPVGLHRVQSRRGDYTLELAPVSPWSRRDQCDFALERAFRVPAADTEEAWVEAWDRTVGGNGGCGDGSGHSRAMLTVYETGEYFVVVTEGLGVFEHYPPQATHGKCGEYEISIVPGHHWCPDRSP